MRKSLKSITICCGIRFSTKAVNIAVAVGRRASKTAVSPDVIDHPPALAPLRILRAEDGKANQTLAVGLLTKWGHTVQIAENGEDTIALWKSRSCDVILMDVQMPVMDGLKATQRIRELEHSSGKHIPIVAMTARAMTGDRERCLAIGMDDYVSKPVRRSELERALREVAIQPGEAPVSNGLPNLSSEIPRSIDPHDTSFWNA